LALYLIYATLGFNCGWQILSTPLGGEFVINCAGLRPDFRIIPGRGDSYKISGSCIS
jgi:hypothetical protein